ncbi:Fe-S protein assembly co-chaperone HscB [Buchnera aphidicola (Thelaxes californica)]|uniref:Co-chaperone protein HscB n=1 Tax=Buchnera aphidicola (Thelaxes californica) TaxID=1315998 RepID=A0A4D6YFS2_9GAMM|nr:Fe-S protein assembly co-chaperone HscB [Buchnera aphidicola]QCI26983.1 Fe-S protein assembly co-chaperone HscB [Buchnera aphidicola (Thelaxes californica)]
MNYFQMFNFPVIFNLNIQEIKKKFYQLQKKYHPDLSIYNKKEKNINKLLLLSSTVNKAYNILKNPITRAEYLISLYTKKEDTKLKQHTQRKFLKLQFQLYEKFEYLKKKKQDLNIFYTEIKILEKKFFKKMEKKLYEKKWSEANIYLEQLKYFYQFQKFIYKK